MQEISRMSSNDDDDDDFKFNECMQASGPMTLDTTENGRNYLVKRKL
jgi:hypothetical protein